MSNTKRMREALAKRQADQAKREEAAPTEDPPKKPPKPEPVIADPDSQVLHTCGHKTGIRNWSTQPCRDCSEKQRKARITKKRDERLDVRLKAEKEPDDSKRLPDASEFWAVYDAATKRWKGSLAFGPVAERIILSDDSGAIMKLLKKLDAQYREHLAKKAGAPCNPETTPG